MVIKSKGGPGDKRRVALKVTRASFPFPLPLVELAFASYTTPNTHYIGTT